MECRRCFRNCFIRSSGLCALHDEEARVEYWRKECKKERQEKRNLKRKLDEYEKPDEEILAELAQLADEEDEREQKRKAELREDFTELLRKLTELEKKLEN